VQLLVTDDVDTAFTLVVGVVTEDGVREAGRFQVGDDRHEVGTVYVVVVEFRHCTPLSRVRSGTRRGSGPAPPRREAGRSRPGLCRPARRGTASGGAARSPTTSTGPRPALGWSG